MENNKIPEETNQKQPESIFSEEDFINQGYDKHIKQARNAIFAAAIILIINIIVLAFTVPDDYEFLWIDILVYGAFVAGFIFLGFWTKKKPYYAIIAALILYGLFIALNAIIDIHTIYKGLIMKIVIIVLLVKGINDAKEAQERKEMIGK